MSGKHCERLPTNNRSEVHRALWERPILCRLATNQAEGGGGPGNDGQGGGGGSCCEHS